MKRDVKVCKESVSPAAHCHTDAGHTTRYVRPNDKNDKRRNPHNERYLLDGPRQACTLEVFSRKPARRQVPFDRASSRIRQAGALRGIYSR